MNRQARHIIQSLGGPEESMEFFGVTRGAISQWLYGGMPPKRLLQLLMKRPDIFASSQAASNDGTEHSKEAA